MNLDGQLALQQGKVKTSICKYDHFNINLSITVIHSRGPFRVAFLLLHLYKYMSLVCGGAEIYTQQP